MSALIEGRVQRWWRPANGYAVAFGSFVGVVGVCLLFGYAIAMKDAAAIAAIPNLAMSIAAILAVPGAGAGISAWQRGKLQREEAKRP